MLLKEIAGIPHIFTAENALDCRADVLNHAPHLIKDGQRTVAECLLNPAAHFFKVAGNQFDCKGNAADYADNGQKLSSDTS